MIFSQSCWDDMHAKKSEEWELMKEINNGAAMSHVFLRILPLRETINYRMKWLRMYIAFLGKSHNKELF